MRLIVLSCLIVITVAVPVVDQQWYNRLNAFGCASNERCSTVIRVLLDPKLMSSWTTQNKSVDKTLRQLEAYQQLFSTDRNEEDDSTVERDSSADDVTQNKDRLKRKAAVKEASERSSKNDNMYWLIRMPGK